MTQNDMSEKLTMVRELTPLPDDTPEYPPKGTPNECLGICIDGDLNMEVLGHTGRYFHGQFVEAGVSPEESGMPSCPIIGYFVFEKGEVWSYEDWETRVVDDYGIDGVYREPTLQDFEKFDVDPPRFVQDLCTQLVESQKENTELRSRLERFALTRGSKMKPYNPSVSDMYNGYLVTNKCEICGAEEFLDQDFEHKDGCLLQKGKDK